MLLWMASQNQLAIFYSLPVRTGRSGLIRSVGQQEVDLLGGDLLVVDFEFVADTLVKDIVLESRVRLVDTVIEVNMLLAIDSILESNIGLLVHIVLVVNLAKAGTVPEVGVSLVTYIGNTVGTVLAIDIALQADRMLQNGQNLLTGIVTGQEKGAVAGDFDLQLVDMKLVGPNPYCRELGSRELAQRLMQRVVMQGTEALLRSQQLEGATAS
jgi:hypothetical protein